MRKNTRKVEVQGMSDKRGKKRQGEPYAGNKQVEAHSVPQALIHKQYLVY